MPVPCCTHEGLWARPWGQCVPEEPVSGPVQRSALSLPRVGGPGMCCPAGTGVGVLCHRPDLKAQPFQKVGTARTSALEAFGSLLGPFSWLVFLIQ